MEPSCSRKLSATVVRQFLVLADVGVGVRLARCEAVDMLRVLLCAVAGHGSDDGILPVDDINRQRPAQCFRDVAYLQERQALAVCHSFCLLAEGRNDLGRSASAAGNVVGRQGQRKPTSVTASSWAVVN